MDSSVVGHGLPSASAILHSFSCLSFLSLYLVAVSFAASFFFFTASPCRQLASCSSGTGGIETWPLWITPCKRDQVRIKEWGEEWHKSTTN